MRLLTHTPKYMYIYSQRSSQYQLPRNIQLHMNLQIQQPPFPGCSALLKWLLLSAMLCVVREQANGWPAIPTFFIIKLMLTDSRNTVNLFICQANGLLSLSEAQKYSRTHIVHRHRESSEGYNSTQTTPSKSTTTTATVIM